LSVSVEKLGERGRATVAIDGVDCGSVEIPRTLRMISSNGMDVGCDPGSAVSDDYVAPHRFEGRIRRLVFEMPPRSRDDEREAARVEAAVAMARQ
jgi:arylsulfatase